LSIPQEAALKRAVEVLIELNLVDWKVDGGDGVPIKYYRRMTVLDRLVKEDDDQPKPRRKPDPKKLAEEAAAWDATRDGAPWPGGKENWRRVDPHTGEPLE